MQFAKQVLDFGITSSDEICKHFPFDDLIKLSDVRYHFEVEFEITIA